MTRNNLREHLTWLLASIPSNPPPRRPPGNNGLTSQSFSSHNNIESLPGSQTVRSGQCPNNGSSGGGEGENYSENPPPSTSQVPVFPSDETMARLQSGPRASKKSCLLSQPMLEPLQTPKAFQPLDSATSVQRDASNDQSASDLYGPVVTIKKKKPLTPTMTKSKTRDVNAIPSSVDLSRAVDLPYSSSSTDEVFGEPRQIWREDSASRKEPVIKRGKKRSSEEFESELKLSQSGFTAVEAFPEEAPPPYSETYENSAYTEAVPQKKFESRHPAVAVVDSRGDTLNGSRVSNKRPKIVSEDAFSMVPKVSMPSEKLLGKGCFSRDRSKAADYEIQAATTERRRTIADSEEENEDQIFDELDESFWTERNPGAHHKNRQATYPALPKNSSSHKAHSNHAPVGHSLGLEEPVMTDSNNREPLYPIVSSDPSPFQCDSPTKLPSMQVQQTEKSDDTGSQLTTVKKASIKAFLAMKHELIRNYHQELIRARTAAAEKLYHRVFEQGGEPTTAMQQQSASLKAKIDATNTLLQLRESHIALSLQKEALKSRLIAAITEERPTSEYAQQLNENTTAALNLAQMERQISSLLVQAEIPLQENTQTCQEKVSEITTSLNEPNQRSTLLVKSTQLPRKLHDICSSRDSIPNSDRLKPSQDIQQTQGVGPNPRTPQKQCTRSNSVTYRSPLQTYMSSPRATNVNAYFSPSKRKPRQDLCVTVDARQGHTKDLPVPHPAPVSLPSRKSASIDDHEEKYSRNMGSPLRMVIDEENYGQEEDDDDMLEAAEEFEKYGVKSNPSSWPTPQTVFAESTGNVVRAEHRKALLANGQVQASHMQHPWSREVKVAMKERFHLRGFRPNQLEAINATLSGKDTFVLMPTGGGKSLCYQLPSIIRSGKTRGVTVVFSPLLSLMQDQVEHLRALKIQAFLINSEVTREERMMVMESLREQQVEKFIQLLYITPEMINKSQAMVSALRELYERKKLARIVIDEAHCVSEWGHDFRPDYKLLGDVRKEFVGVPVMALTATATENAKVDVVHNLGIQGCEVLTQSFNRPNLTYEVRSKGRSDKVLESIAATIQTLYKNQSGIIYCLSRKNCEKVAQTLREQYHITAEHYHAGMDSQSKNSAQKRWQSGKYHVIVATIAFGMGIDKPDVRFVIHHSMPKSLEGYYQETGRAGRDGKQSGCYLYYGRQDLLVFKRIIDDGEGSLEQKERQHQMLRNVVGFCENKSDCRRVQVLRYFDETFRREDCNGACDNCTSKSSFETQDYTDYAVAAIALVKRIEKDKVTLLHCVDVFRGGKGKKIVGRHHDKLPQHGACSHLERGDVERLFYRLLSEEALMEQNVVNKKSGFPSKYLYLGPNYHLFARGGKKVNIQIRVSPKSNKVKATEPVKNRVPRNAVSRPEYPISTNVSSPIQVASRRRVDYQLPHAKVTSNLNGYSHDDFVISDNDCLDSDDESDYFESVREAGKPEKSKARKLGPPITIDEKLEGVDPAHRFVIDDFLVRAKKESDSILLAKNLRAHPFTDTILREMAINFPKDETEMLDIPGIDPDKVERYGQRFLKLIRNAQRGYYEMKQQQDLPRNVPRDPPNDPNHENVINISSDEEFADDYDLDDFMDEDGSQEERSSYFHATPEVDAFNARFSQIETARIAHPPAPSPKRDFPVRNGSRGSHGGGYRAGGGKTWYRRNNRKSSTGAAHNKAAAKPSKSGRKSVVVPRNTNNHSAADGGSKRQHDTGGGGGIGMMPT